MKKILLMITFSLGLFAVDLQENAGNDQSYKESISSGNNKNMSVTKSTDKTETDTHATEKSVQKSKDLVRIEQTTALIALLALEKTNIEPFASCQVLSNPRLPSDFNLACDFGNGYINEGRCSFLSNAAISNFAVEAVTYKTNELLEYSACVGLYGALIAQDMQNDKFSTELKNEDLKKTFMSFSQELEDTKCRMSGNASTIICGSVMLRLDYSPSISFAGISLYSDQKYFGYSASETKNRSKRISDSLSLSKSKRNGKAIALSKSITVNQDTSNSLSKSSSANLSLSKFLPGE